VEFVLEASDHPGYMLCAPHRTAMVNGQDSDLLLWTSDHEACFSLLR
jgi:hypothetical protein